MHKYICKKCDDLKCETSVCPVCGERAELIETEVFYCEQCKTPVYDETCPICSCKTKKVGSDLRPVFAEERLLLEVLSGKPFCYVDKDIWCVGANNYIFDGVKKRLPFTEYRKRDYNEIIDLMNKNSSENLQYVMNDLSNKNIEKFIRANRYRLNIITDEAVDYIKKSAKKFDVSSLFVSFSGGKDSTVTSSLVMKALETESIIHIYGDTTLEYNASEEYVKEFKKRFNKTPVLVAKNLDQDFNNLCEVIGPPSRVMRWCCTIFKTGAITRKIEATFKNKTKILSFQGIRRAESSARNKYDRDTESPKIVKQLVSAPIIDWSDFDVWLYILANKLPFNYAYRQGFSRVGCWCCPNNSAWSEFLSSIYMNEKYVYFRKILYSFAKKVGKSDWKEYIDEGNWKARQGGNGLDVSKNTVVTFKPCAFDENSVNFILSRKIDTSLYTMFKPFGKVNFEIGNKRLGEVYILSRKTNEPVLKIAGKVGKDELKITLLKKIHSSKSVKENLELVKNQITKFQSCIGCTYCQSVCKFNALKVFNLNKGNVSTESISYEIDDSKCIGCLECVKHFTGGCYMKKVLRIKKEGENGSDE